MVEKPLKPVPIPLGSLKRGRQIYLDVELHREEPAYGHCGQRAPRSYSDAIGQAVIIGQIIILIRTRFRGHIVGVFGRSNVRQRIFVFLLIQ